MSVLGSINSIFVGPPLSPKALKREIRHFERGLQQASPNTVKEALVRLNALCSYDETGQLGRLSCRFRDQASETLVAKVTKGKKGRKRTRSTHLKSTVVARRKAAARALRLSHARASHLERLEERDRKALQKETRRLLRPFHAYYRDLSNRGQAPRGEVEILFDIAPNGKTANVRVFGTSLRNEAMVEQIQRVFERMNFRPRWQAYDVHYRLRLTPFKQASFRR